MILEYNLAFNKLLKILRYSSLTTRCKAVSKTRVIVFILNVKATLEMKELKLGGGRMLDIWIMLKGGSRSHLFALLHFLVTLSWVQFSSVTQSCPTLCDPMNRSMPGLPVHHQLPEFTQTHVHRVSDAIQPSHPLSFPYPPAPNPSQHQSLF